MIFSTFTSPFGPTDTRGVYKTTDGGKTWNRVLHVDDNTGVTDIGLDPAVPTTLYAGTLGRGVAPNGNGGSVVGVAPDG